MRMMGERILRAKLIQVSDGRKEQTSSAREFVQQVCGASMLCFSSLASPPLFQFVIQKKHDVSCPPAD